MTWDSGVRIITDHVNRDGNEVSPVRVHTIFLN